MMPALARVQGSMLGGAIGDALGAPVEFMSLAKIRQRFGSGGIRDYAPAYGRPGAITDTQMTMFTAEGLIRARVRALERGICHPPGVIHHAYLRWLLTQGGRTEVEVGRDGWLFACEALHSQRAPGMTCLSALEAARSFGTPAENDSKGCGGVMRVAPVGLFAPVVGGMSEVFGLGADTAALTHGHPSGFLAAGHLAVTIAGLCRGAALEDALGIADAELSRHPRHEEVAGALAQARALAARDVVTPETLETLGGGWVAEEALAIAVCCALAAGDFAEGVILAANHSGDTDSTAAIAGNLLGALWGTAALPVDWLAGLELRADIARLADDLHASTLPEWDVDAAWDAYPGW